jgi:voltage-gated potassium channel
VFKVAVPDQLAGKSLADSNIRQLSGCTVIGIDRDDETTTNPSPLTVLEQDSEIVLIGTPAGEREFLRQFPSREPGPAS